MTAGELIEKLRQVPPDADVRFAFYDVHDAEAVVLNTKDNVVELRDDATELCGYIEGEERFL
jgi:hypothetical protein